MSSVSSSWLRAKLAHWQSGGIAGSAASACSSGADCSRASARYIAWLTVNENSICSSSPSSSPKNVRWSSGGRLTSPSSTASPLRRPRKRRRSRVQLVRVHHRAAGHPHRLEHERDGVDAEAAEPLLEPEADDLRDLVADLRVGHVEVGLVRVEAVQVVLAGLLVPRPVGVLLVGEDEVAGLLRRLLVDPDVEVAVGGVRVRARGLEPRVLVGGVVHHQVGDHADAAVARGAHQLDEVAVGPEPRVDAVEVGDVVAVVLARRGVERHQPQARDADAGEVVDALGQAREVAAAVGVGVQERLDVEAVEDGVLPPEVAGGLGLHRSSGSTRSPKASMNGSSSCPTWWR